MSNSSYDVEKHPAEAGVGNVRSELRPSYVDDDGAVPGESFEYGTGWSAKMHRLAGKLKIEQRGIERVPENERTDSGFKGMLNVSTMVSVESCSACECCTPAVLSSAANSCVSGSPPTWS